MEHRLAAAGSDVDDHAVVLEPGQPCGLGDEARACAAASSAGKSPTSRNVSTCRSGRTRRCVGAFGRDVADRDEAIRRVDVIAVPRRAGRRGSRDQAATASTPSSATATARALTKLADGAVHEPGRVVVRIPAAGPVDEHPVDAPDARLPAATRELVGERTEPCAPLPLDGGRNRVGVGRVASPAGASKGRRAPSSSRRARRVPACARTPPRPRPGSRRSRPS